MIKALLIEKYTLLSKKADTQLSNFHAEMKSARALKNLNDSTWEQLADYEAAKAEYRCQKRTAQIYGRICADLGDA